MPITFQIDPERRIVFARGLGVLSDEDVFEYQRTVWSREDIRGYNELIDMRGVEQIGLPSMDRVRDLANLSAEMDAGARGAKFAIVASSDLAFGLGRMYEAYRGMNPRSGKEVKVFRDPEEALKWLEEGAGTAS
jgi:TPR repeat protein